MQYLCVKQLAAGGVAYHPGSVIPDGVILPERSSKLLRNGYIAEMPEEKRALPVAGVKKLYTEEEVNTMLSEAIEDAVNNTISELQPGAYNGMVTLRLKGESAGEMVEIPVTAGELQQVFAIMQLSAEETVKVIGDVESENVLILLHAADNRKMVKNAAKTRADQLSNPGGKTNAPTACNAATDTGQGG